MIPKCMLPKQTERYNEPHLPPPPLVTGQVRVMAMRMTMVMVMKVVVSVQKDRVLYREGVSQRALRGRTRVSARLILHVVISWSKRWRWRVEVRWGV